MSVVPKHNHTGVCCWVVSGVGAAPYDDPVEGSRLYFSLYRANVRGYPYLSPFGFCWSASSLTCAPLQDMLVKEANMYKNKQLPPSQPQSEIHRGNPDWPQGAETTWTLCGHRSTHFAQLVMSAVWREAGYATPDPVRLHTPAHTLVEQPHDNQW